MIKRTVEIDEIQRKKRKKRKTDKMMRGVGER